MHRPSAEEFLSTLLETMDELPPDLAERFDALLKKKDHVDRPAAIRQLFEDLAGD
jgi:metal-responsive CopG/Arc/MetJ family transcriptional regulator